MIYLCKTKGCKKTVEYKGHGRKPSWCPECLHKRQLAQQAKWQKSMHKAIGRELKRKYKEVDEFDACFSSFPMVCLVVFTIRLHVLVDYVNLRVRVPFPHQHSILDCNHATESRAI